MDIAGAKALKERLGSKGLDEEVRRTSVDVHEDAPPVYQWLQVCQREPESAPVAAADDPNDGSTSIFRRLGLSFR